MTKQVQRRRGTSSQHTSFTGAEGEISVNTTNKSVHVHDGVTAGGVEAARADLANVSDASLNTALAGNTLSSLTITSADINGGTIDGTVIGGTTPAAVTATSLTATGTTTLAGASTTADITFGDNDKAIFGAGSALQIYHDGTRNYIDSDTTELRLQTSELRMVNSSNTEIGLKAVEDGAVTLYYDANPKLATTSTGIDVTGTVTADGLTVAPDANRDVRVSSFGTYSMRLENTSVNAGGLIDLKSNGGITVTSGSKSILKADGATGDISFYEDTGTTPKFFWDASAESVIVGGTAAVNLGDTTGNGVQLNEVGINIKRTCTSSTQGLLQLNNIGTDGNVVEFYIDGTQTGALGVASGAALTFVNGTGSSEAMRLDASGNLLVGKTTTSSTVDGVTAFGVGAIEVVRSSNALLYLNRKTSDGDIAVFRKDGTTVGSIGSVSGNSIFVGSADVGVRFSDVNDAIYPVTTGGINRDAATDLGLSTVRFKDLYLSGGVKGSGTSTFGTGLANGISVGGSSSTNAAIFGTSANQDVNMSANGTGNVKFLTGASASGLGSASERMRINSSGALLINTTTTNYSENLKVDGGVGGYAMHTIKNDTGAQGHFVFSNPNGAVGGIFTSGTSTSYNTTSDYRLKENVITLDGAADRLAQIPVHRFNFIADADTTVDGFLAHEVQAIVPEAVTGEKDAVDADGNPIYQGIDHSKLVPLLTAALQEALGRIETLEAEVAALKA